MEGINIKDRDTSYQDITAKDHRGLDERRWTHRQKEDPGIPLLGIYPEKTIIQKDTCTPMFIAALFTIARTWK